METRQKHVASTDDVSLTPTRKSTRFYRVDQDGGDVNGCAKPKITTPKRCTKVYTEPYPSDSIGGACTMRMTRSRGKKAATSPHESTRKPSKQGAGVRCQIQADTPARITRYSARMKGDNDGSASKMTKYSFDMDSESKKESPLISATSGSHKDSETYVESPSRQTRAARPSMKSNCNVLDLKERHAHSKSSKESCMCYQDDTNTNPDSVVKSSPRLNKPNSKLSIGKQTSILNTKSFNDINARNNSEEKLKNNCQRQSKINDKRECVSVCTSKHTNIHLLNVEGTFKSEQKQRGGTQGSTKRSVSVSPAGRDTGEICKETSHTMSRQTRRCIIFTDSDESNVKEGNKSTSTSETLSPCSPLPLAFKTWLAKTEGEQDRDALIAYDTRMVTARQSKQVVSKNVISSLDEEPISDPRSKLNNIFITSRRSPRLMNKYGNRFANGMDSESRNSNLVIKRSSKCSSSDGNVVGSSNTFCDYHPHLPEHQSVRSKGVVSLLQQKPDPAVKLSAEFTSRTTTECNRKNNHFDLKLKMYDSNVSNSVQSTQKQKRTEQIETVSLNMLKENEKCSDDNIVSLKDLNCCETTRCVAVCKNIVSNACFINSHLTIASFNSGKCRGVSENTSSKQSNDVLSLQSCASHKVEDNDDTCIQNSLPIVLNCDSSEEHTDVSGESDDETRYNVNDFVSRRRRLRSESQDSELWEGLPTSVRNRKSVSRCRHIKSTDAQMDFTMEDETCMSSKLFNSTDDLDQHQQFSSTIINSTTDSQSVTRCQEQTMANGCKNEDTDTLSQTKYFSVNNAKNSEIKRVTALAKSTEVGTSSKVSFEMLHPILLSKGFSRSLGDSSTGVIETTSEIHEAGNSQVYDHPCTSQKCRTDIKEREHISLLKTDAKCPKTPIPTRVTENTFQTDNSNNVNNTKSCNKTESSSKENKILQETCVVSSANCNTDRSTIEDAYNLELETTKLRVSSCSDIKRETSNGISSISRPCTRNRAAKCESNHNKYSGTSGRQCVSNEMVANKSEIFWAPAIKCCASAQRKYHTAAQEVESKSELSNAGPRYALKNTPRPTSSHSAPWMYDIQKLNGDSCVSPVLNCRSKAKSRIYIQASTTINCKSKVVSTDNTTSNSTLRCSSQIKCTRNSHQSVTSEILTCTKTTELNTICSSSNVNISVTKSDQYSKTSVSLISSQDSSSSEIQKSTEPNNTSKENSVRSVKSKLDGKIPDMNSNKSSLTAHLQADDKIISLPFSGQQNTFETVSVLQERTDSPQTVNTKLNQKSKFPKVVLTPLKRSQRLLEKYGSESPLREFRIKQKRKRSEAHMCLKTLRCETPGISRDTNDNSSDLPQPAPDMRNDQDRKAPFRKHRRKQDLLGHQRVDTTDVLDDTSLPKFRKKSHSLGYSFSPEYDELTERVQKIKDGEKRKSKKGKCKQRANPTVSTPSNMFGLRRKREPAVDEELLANPLYNKHACVLWSSEHRRHYHLIHPEADFNELDNILRKHWEELLPSEKMRYFNRARDAVLDEFKHSKKPSNASKQKTRSKDNDLNITPMEKFCQLNAKRQKELLSKWLYFYQKVLSCRDYKLFIADVQTTLNSIQSLQKGEHKRLTSRKLEHRKLLFEKINKVKPRVISQYMERCRRNTRSHDLHQKRVIQNLIRGVPQNFPKGYRAKCVTTVLEDLRELESRSLLNVIGIPKCTPSYTNVFKGIVETSKPSDECCSTSNVGNPDQYNNKDGDAIGKTVSDTVPQRNTVLSPLQDMPDNDYANKIIDELHTLNELPILELSVIDSVFTDLASSNSEHLPSVVSSSTPAPVTSSTEATTEVVADVTTTATATEEINNAISAKLETTTTTEKSTLSLKKATAAIITSEIAATKGIATTSTAATSVSTASETVVRGEKAANVNRFIVKVLHKEAVDAFERSQSGNGETCCELDSPSCILSTWLIADRVGKEREHAQMK